MHVGTHMDMDDHQYKNHTIVELFPTYLGRTTIFKSGRSIVSKCYVTYICVLLS